MMCKQQESSKPMLIGWLALYPRIVNSFGEKVGRGPDPQVTLESVRLLEAFLIVPILF